MKVYTVIKVVYGEEATIAAVYSDELLAQELANTLDDERSATAAWVEEQEVYNKEESTESDLRLDPDHPYQIHYSVGRALQTLKEFKRFPEKEEWHIDEAISRLERISEWFTKMDKGLLK